MEPDRSDTNLLFGILAVKMNFIAKEDLFEAMGIWFLDRRKALGDILVERQARAGRDRDLLDAMVRESQARKGQPLKSGSHDRPDAPTRPSDSIGPTEVPAVEPVRSPSENGHPNNGDMTITWSARREHGDEPYVVLRPHAKGGIGKVSVALDVALNREVALKQLLDDHLDQAESRARFLLEAEVTARLEHPGIVPSMQSDAMPRASRST